MTVKNTQTIPNIGGFTNQNGESMKEVYLVFKNADFTEGRGPMLLHKVFDTFQNAEDYVMGQDGIYGSEQRKDEYGYNGYSIEKHTVLGANYTAQLEQEEIEYALNKLTPRERHLLNVQVKPRN